MGKRFVLLGTLVGLGLLATACAPAAQPPAPAAEKKEAPAPAAKELDAWKTGLNDPEYAEAVSKRCGATGGVMRFRNYSTPPTLDPHRTLIGAYTSSGHGQAYSRLLRYRSGPNQEIYSYAVEPELARSWKQINDVTWEFYLAKGVKWQNIPPVNGRELTAEDIVFSFTRQMTKGWDNATLLEPIIKMEAPDKYTFRITLSQPDSDILAKLADGHAKIVAKEVVEATNNDLSKGPTIGSSPWIVTEYEKDAIIKFKKNPDYFEKGVPCFDGLESYIIRDDAARFAALRAKRLDFEAISPVWRQTLERDQSPLLASVTDKKSPSGKQFGLKVDKPPFNDVRVRQAIMFGWNREDLNKSVYQGKAWYQPVGYMSGLQATLPEEETLSKYFKHDPALAKKLLADAGFANGIDVEFTVANYGNDYVSQAQLMEQQWKEAGIRAKIKIIEPQVYTQKILFEGLFDMFMGPYTPVPGPNSFLYTNYHSKSERNVSKIKDAKLDQMIDTITRETNDEKRTKLLLDVQRYILEDASNYNSQASLSATGAWPYLKYVYGSGAYPYEEKSFMWFDTSDPTWQGRPK